MTEQRWEYASVVYADTLKKITKTDPEYMRLTPQVLAEWEQSQWSFYWWREADYYVWLPGGNEPEKRHIWATPEEKRAVELLDVLNELGASGWEVIDYEVVASAMTQNLGWSTAGLPIHTTVLLKRLLA